MGRSGGHSGGGGGSHSSHSSFSHSHSSHSSSRSSGGYHSSSSSGSYHSSGNYHSTPSNRYRRNRYGSYGYGGYGGYRSNPASSAVSAVCWLVVIVILVLFLWIALRPSFQSATIVASTVNRERLDGGSFTENCVQDDLGWIREEGVTEKSMGAKLQPFWDATGIQPYVVMLPYEEAFDDPDYRFDWSDQYYYDNIGREDAMLLVYFDAEPDGNWEMVCGNLTGSVLDPEAKEIFWSVLDSYWNDLDNTVPEAIEKAFKAAGDRIMTKTTTGADVAKRVAMVFIILAAGVSVIAVMMVHRRHEAEKAAEAEKILNTPLEKMTAENDPLVDKYSGDGP